MESKGRNELAEDVHCTRKLSDVTAMFGLARKTNQAPSCEYRNIIHGSWIPGEKKRLYHHAGYWPFRLPHMIANVDLGKCYGEYIKEYDLSDPSLTSAIKSYYPKHAVDDFFLHNAGNSVFFEGKLFMATLLMYAVTHPESTKSIVGLPLSKPWGDATVAIVDFQGMVKGMDITEIGIQFYKISELARHPVADWANHLSVCHFRIWEARDIVAEDLKNPQAQDRWYPETFRRPEKFRHRGNGPTESLFVKRLDVDKILQAAHEIPVDEEPLAHLLKVHASIDPQSALENI